MTPTQKWTPDRINQLLLLVIKRHYSGTPDYDYLAAQLGVTREAVRLKFQNLRRTEAAEGAALHPQASPGKRKAKSQKQREIKSESTMDGGIEVKRENGKKAKTEEAAEEKAEKDFTFYCVDSNFEG